MKSEIGSNAFGSKILNYFINRNAKPAHAGFAAAPVGFDCDVISVIHNEIIGFNKFKGKQQVSLQNFGLASNLTRFASNLSSCGTAKTRGILTA